MGMAGAARASGADLDTLLAQADPAAPTAERHLWLVHVLDWLRHGDNPRGDDVPLAVLRLRHLLVVLDALGVSRCERAFLFDTLQQLQGLGNDSRSPFGRMRRCVTVDETEDGRIEGH